MAKIHTVEWTPALLAHPTTVKAIRATWWGLLGERAHRKLGRIGAGELLSGIPGSRLDDEVPYAITEEFVTVYRMHQLIPDEIEFFRADTGEPVDGVPGGSKLEFEELTATKWRPPSRQGEAVEHRLRERVVLTRDRPSRSADAPQQPELQAAPA